VLCLCCAALFCSVLFCSIRAGIISGYPGWGPPGAPTTVVGSATVKVVFTSPGVYNVICPYHDLRGMIATVTVQAAATTPPCQGNINLNFQNMFNGITVKTGP
jgi:hypothetical protein